MCEIIYQINILCFPFKIALSYSIICIKTSQMSIIKICACTVHQNVTICKSSNHISLSDSKNKRQWHVSSVSQILTIFCHDDTVIFSRFHQIKVKCHHVLSLTVLSRVDSIYEIHCKHSWCFMWYIAPLVLQEIYDQTFVTCLYYIHNKLPD